MASETRKTLFHSTVSLNFSTITTYVFSKDVKDDCILLANKLYNILWQETRKLQFTYFFLPMHELYFCLKMQKPELYCTFDTTYEV